MFKKLALLVFCCAVYWAYAEYAFSDDHLRQWLLQHSLDGIANDQAACEHYDAFAEVHLVGEQAGTRRDDELNKTQICAHLRMGAAAFHVMQAQVNMSLDELVVRRSRFPWLEADLAFTERTRVSAPDVPAFVIVSEETMTLRRTFAGLRITQHGASAKRVAE